MLGSCFVLRGLLFGYIILQSVGHDGRRRVLDSAYDRLVDLRLCHTDTISLCSKKLILILIGIGLMLAKALAHNKAKRVYIIGRRKEKLGDAVEQIGREGVVVPLVGDVTDQRV